MPSIELSTIAGALVAATIAVAGPAQADEPAPKKNDENISIDINLLGCSIGAGLGTDLILAAGAGNGSGATINSGLAARLRAAGCLPWD